MEPYHKIQTVWKRDANNNNKTLLTGEYSLPELEYLKHNRWTFTEKVDGTNIRVIYEDSDLAFKGKMDKTQIPSFLEKRLRDIFLPSPPIFHEVFPDSTDPICLYGEGYGAKIQKGGGNYKSTPDFVLFDVKVGDWWLQRKDVEDIASKLSLDVVPIVGKGTLLDMIVMVRDGFDSHWGDFPAEGIVARPTTELQRRNGDRIITKVKHRDFGRK